MTHPWHRIVATAAGQHPSSPMPQQVAAAVRAVLEPVARADRPDAVEVRWPELVVAAMRCGETPERLCDLYLIQYRAAALVAAWTTRKDAPEGWSRTHTKSQRYRAVAHRNELSCKQPSRTAFSAHDRHHSR